MFTLWNENLSKKFKDIHEKNIELQRENAQIELLRILNDKGIITLAQRAEYANKIMQGTLEAEIKAVA